MKPRYIKTEEVDQILPEAATYGTKRKSSNRPLNAYNEYDGNHLEFLSRVILTIIIISFLQMCFTYLISVVFYDQ